MSRNELPGDAKRMITGGPTESRGRADDGDASRLDSASLKAARQDSGRDDAAKAFAELAKEVRTSVDAQLAEVLEAAVMRARAQGPEVGAVVEAVRSLSMRGGKRLRAVLVAAAYEACGGEGGAQVVVPAGVALELLQTYLLIHDDWMDDDDVRRGGPSVHAMLRARFESRDGTGEPRPGRSAPGPGDAAAILAGDHASALAQNALLGLAIPPQRVLEAARVFARIQEDVILGQLLDIRGASGSSVEAMHDLKTGSYTVRGPLRLGAILAGATHEAHEALVRFAAPLGIAFQLRDDLLGTFGDPKETGKPAGNDVRVGKHTALVAELANDEEAQTIMKRTFGVIDAPQADVDALVRRMKASGARARVEARLRDLLVQAQRELHGAPLNARGKAVLEGAVLAIGERER